MDTEIKNKLNTLKELGIDEQRLLALVQLCFEDFLDEMEEDLVEASQEDLDSLAKEVASMKKEKMNPDQATSSLKEILKKVYGLSAESTWNSYLSKYLDTCITDANSIKDFVAKLEDNDPEALKQVIIAQQDPDFDNVKSAVEEASQL